MSTEQRKHDGVGQKGNAALKRAVEELSVLNEMAQAVAISTDLNGMLHTIVKRSLQALNADQGVITLVDEEREEKSKTLVRVVVHSSETKQFHFNEGLLGWMLLHKKPLLVNDPNRHPQFNRIPWDEPIASLLCVPMLLQGALIGVLTVYNSQGKVFNDADQRLLTIIAAQMAQGIHNARLDKEKKEMQMRIARDLHDDVGSSLSSIALYAENLKRHIKEGSHQTSELIDKMAELSLDAVDTMGDIVWSLTEDNESFADIVDRMARHAIELLAARNIRYRLKTSPEVKKIALPSPVYKNLFLIYKEALHNICKHSKATAVSIEFTVSKGTLTMHIDDDGIGFSPETVTRSNGLRNMERRARDMNAEYTVLSRRGTGTSIRVAREIA